MECPNCQHKNRAAAKFCENCGHILQVMCPNCGSSNRPGAKFCDNCGHRLDAREKTPVDVLPSPSQISRFIPKELASKLESARADGAMEGERRVVTILFCDVKGSTQAAELLDPEEWTEIMNGAFEHMIQPVYQYEGTVARLMGDAVLAFFGAPIAHEDDPQRAVLAGLDILDGIQAYRAQVKQGWGIDFDVRVGINTGLVVVGAVGSDLRMEYTAMGDAINLAARMEQSAQPGTVQIAEDTYRLVASLFEFEDLGGVQIKGKARPIPSYRVLGRKVAPGRQRGIAGLEAPLIGRARERSALEQAIANLDKGLGGIVYLLGEAGLGKSRLLQEVIHSNVEPPAFNAFETLSHSYESGQPYGLFRRLMRRVIGTSANDGPEEMREKIQRVLEEFPLEERAQVQRVFESLFGLPGQAGEAPLEGETFKGLLYNSMASLWLRQAETRPVVLVCDDLHWSDPASLALLQHIYPLTDRAAILLLCAMRPEREAPAWQGMQVAERDFPHRYTEIRLQPLNANESGELVDGLLRISDLPTNLRKRIMEKSEGNPYFVEEVIRTLIDRGVVVRDEDSTRWQATGDGADLDIPGNLQTLLIARIDRLAETARRTLQVAAVVGRSFYFRVLQQIVDIAGELDRQLLTLQQKQLIVEAARLPEREYVFRHTITQEAAYSTILLKQRRTFHRAVGEALESLFPDQRDEMAATLAAHFKQARVSAKALHYYTLAGDVAFRLFAMGEALTSYEQAMEVAERGGASNQQLIYLYRRRGRALELLMRHDEALQAYQALEALGEARGDDALRLAGIAAQGTAYYLGLADLENSRARTEEALALARRLDDRAVEARSLWTLLVSQTWFNPQQALEYGESALQIASEIASRPEATSDDREQLALILVDLSLAHTHTGQMKLASERALEAQGLFEDLDNLPMAATAIERIAFVHAAEGRLERAERTFAQGITLDQSIGNQGGVDSKHFNLLTQDIYPRLGDFSGFFAILETYKPTSVRGETIREYYQDTFYELYPVVAYNYLGAFKQVQGLVGPLLQFLESGTPTFPAILLSHAVLAHIRAGELETGKELLEKCEAHFHVENYILPLVPNIFQAKAELALAEGHYEQALAHVETFLVKAHQKSVRGYDPAKLFLKGWILRESGRPEEAYAAYREAHSLAARQNARPELWKICAHLAEMEAHRGNPDAAQSLKEQARAAIASIADHAGRDDLRTAFLAMPEVQRMRDNGID
jgi:class 3 adenylate cyclase/tetratricopeptide (TPR) repeat protein